jgi:Tfp pilus assembly protein PilX
MSRQPLPHRVSDERGAAMIIAVIVLMITAVLAGAAVTVAVQNNRFSRADVNRKNALEAAEAGLQVAVYRLNMLRPDDSHCIADAVASPDATGTCASSSYTLGNGSAYSYYTTPVLGTGTCVGLTVTSDTNISQRCVTAVGSSGTVFVRSQIRTAAFGARPLFPVSGITGLKSIVNTNNVRIAGWEASNGAVTSSNNVTITGSLELGPTGTYSYANGASNPAKVLLSSPMVLSPVNPGTTNQTSLAGCPTRAAAGFPACNDDYRITNYLSNPSHPTAPYDQSTGVTFNASTRSFSMGNNASITLGGGIYNFCSFSATNNTTINLAPGTKTEIIIDSPDDPGSGCAAGSGTLNIFNNTTWNTLSSDPTALQLYVYGLNDGSNVVNFNNNGIFSGVVYAPQSTVNLSNNAQFTGAISGNVVNLSNNFQFNWGSTAGTLQAASTGLYYRTAWSQCTPQPTTASAPGSGCG